MDIPYTIGRIVREAYKCSIETVSLNTEQGRTIRAENTSWSNGIIPSLKILALRVIISNWQNDPILEELPSCMDRIFLIETLPTDLPFELVISKIPDEYYWQRRAKDRWEFNDLSEHGNSWRRLYCERHFAEYLQQMEPSRNGPGEECEKLIGLLQNYIYSLRIKSLLPNSKPIPSTVTDEVPQLIVEDIVYHIELGSIFSKLPNLTDVTMNFAVIYMNDGFEWRDFQFSIDDARNLGQGLKVCHNLKKFVLTRSNLDQTRVAAILQGLAFNNSLEELNFSHCKLADNGALAIGEFLFLHNNLKTLVLTDNNIGCEGVAGLVYGLLKKDRPTLKYLSLRLNPLCDAGGAHICSLLLRNETLETLDISGCNLEAESGIALAEILASGHLKYTNLSIDLSNNDLGPTVGRAFEICMKTCSCIVALDIRMCNFSKESEFHISESILRVQEKKKRQKPNWSI